MNINPDKTYQVYDEKLTTLATQGTDVTLLIAQKTPLLALAANETKIDKIANNAPAAALAAQLTTITYTAPGTPNYALADLTVATPYGFATHDDGATLLKVVANLQARLATLEANMKTQGLQG